MKAVVYETYGAPEVLELKEVDKPIPKANELLIKVKASSVSAGAVLMRRGAYPGSKIFTFILRLMAGLFKPRKQILGYEVSGIVEAVGHAVTKFSVGDEVFGTTTGLKAGSYAEYVCVPETWRSGVIAKKPKELSFEEAATLPVGGMTAMYLLDKTTINEEDEVLVYGASGSVGTNAIQLAKYYGAKVTAVCSKANEELVRSIGADYVIDYKKQDFRDSNKKYDVIFEAVGLTKAAENKKRLNPDGFYTSIKTPTKEKTEHLNTLAKLAKEGKIKVVIDQVLPMDDIVKAHTYVDKGHKKGNLAIKIS